MNVFQFWADPIGWFVHTFTWWFTAPAWVIALNLLFWPAWIGFQALESWRGRR